MPRTAEELKDIANLFKDRVIEIYPEQVEEIILYGSVARGEVGEKSDIDLLVVIRSKDVKLMKDISGIAFEISIETSEDLSPKVYSRSEIEEQLRQGTPFIEEVLRDEEGLYGSLADIRGAS